MEACSFVSPGSPLLPETASRYNALSDSLNAIPHLGPRSPEALPADTAAAVITGVNNTQEILPAGSFVSVERESSLLDPSLPMAENQYDIRPGTAAPCGILLQECPPGAAAPVQLSGLCEGPDSPAPPHAVRLGPASNGNRYLYLLEAFQPYANYFQALPYTFAGGKLTEIRICDGARPSNRYAGYTDIREVTSAILPVPDKGRFVCLKLNSDYSQEFEILDAMPDERLPYTLIAEIINQNVIQRWTAGKIYWRHRFIIPFAE